MAGMATAAVVVVLTKLRIMDAPMEIALIAILVWFVAVINTIPRGLDRFTILIYRR